MFRFVLAYSSFSNDLKQWAEAGILKRIYDKNGSYTSSFMASRLWVADYAAKNEMGKVLDFNELAESSGEKTGKELNVLAYFGQM